MKIKVTRTHHEKIKNINTWTNTTKKKTSTRQHISAHTSARHK